MRGGICSFEGLRTGTASAIIAVAPASAAGCRAGIETDLRRRADAGGRLLNDKTHARLHGGLWARRRQHGSGRRRTASACSARRHAAGRPAAADGRRSTSRHGHPQLAALRPLRHARHRRPSGCDVAPGRRRPTRRTRRRGRQCRGVRRRRARGNRERWPEDLRHASVHPGDLGAAPAGRRAVSIPRRAGDRERRRVVRVPGVWIQRARHRLRAVPRRGEAPASRSPRAWPRAPGATSSPRTTARPCGCSSTGSQVGSRPTTAPLASPTGRSTSAAVPVPERRFSPWRARRGRASTTALSRAATSRRTSHAGATSPCTAIDGASGRDYTPTGGDLGRTLRVVNRPRADHASAAASRRRARARRRSTTGGQLVQPAILTRPRAPRSGASCSSPRPWPASRPTGSSSSSTASCATPRSEPPFQYTWYTGAEPNGSHTLAVRVLRPAQHGARDRRAQTVTVSNKTVYPTPLPFGKESIYAEFNEGDAATANNLLDNVWPARGFPLPKLGWPLTWTEDPYNDAFWRFYHYGLRPESSLLYEWQTTGERRYLDKLARDPALVRGLRRDPPGQHAHVRQQPRGGLPGDDARQLLPSSSAGQGCCPSDLRAGPRVRAREARRVPRRARRTSRAASTTASTRARRCCSSPTTSPICRVRAAWRQTALDRLQEMLDTTLDPDGVEIENSPFYHVYVLGLVYQIAPVGDGSTSRRSRPRYTRRAQTRCCATPRTSPSRTATCRCSARRRRRTCPRRTRRCTARWRLPTPSSLSPSAAALAARRRPTARYLFPSSGLFLMRSPLGSATSNLAQQTFVTFDAGPYRTEHSDLDALGITMYSNGSTRAAGVGPVHLHRPAGPRATSTAPARTTPSSSTAAIRCRAPPMPGLFGSNGGRDVGDRARATLYAGVTHRRSVVVLRQGLTLVRRPPDRSASSHTYTQTWHLPPDASLDVRRPGRRGHRAAPGKRILHDPPGRSRRRRLSRPHAVRRRRSCRAGTRRRTARRFPPRALEYARKGERRNVHHAARRRAVCVADEHRRHARRSAARTGSTYASAAPSATRSPFRPDPVRLSVTGGVVRRRAGALDARPGPAPPRRSDPLVLSPADETAVRSRSRLEPGEIPVLLFHSVCPTCPAAAPTT